jgi:hypothetical protein
MPCEQIFAALARALNLGPGEQDHSAPRRALRDEQASLG